MTAAPRASIAQQLVYYDSMFELLDEIRALEDIAQISEKIAKRWKYFANVFGWRLVIAYKEQYLIIDGSKGIATLNTVNLLCRWDAHFWNLARPTLISNPDELNTLPSAPEHLIAESTKDVYVIPFMRKNQLIALLTTSSSASAFNKLDKKFIRLFGGYFADTVVDVLIRDAYLDNLRNLAIHDGLTGAYNRAYMIDASEKQYSLAKRTGLPITIILADIDFFKHVNDAFGHQAGDEVLRECVRRWHSAIRMYDSLGRYGGEEFIFVLYPCNENEAAIACERFRKFLADEHFIINDKTLEKIPVTCSFGVASSETCESDSVEELIHFADNALYESKKAGRNKTTIAHQ